MEDFSGLFLDGQSVNFATLIVGKVEARKATEGNDAGKLGVPIERIQSLT